MGEKSSSSDQQGEIRGGASPYDLGILIAKSFGKSLPAVVIVVLIALGAWYAIREMQDLDTQRSTALIEAAQAKADAKTAADRAKLEALQEQSKQLANLNGVTADVSKRLQELVSAQIDNMSKANQLAEAQDKKTREYQDQLEKAQREKLESLETQVKEEKNKQQELAHEVILARYDIHKQITKEALAGGLFIQDSIIKALEQDLKESAIEEEAKKDAANKNESWQLRIALDLLLFKSTAAGAYLDEACALADQNKGEVHYAMAYLFSRPDAFSVQQHKESLVHISELAATDGFSKDARNQLLISPLFFDPEIASVLGNRLGSKLAHSVGVQLIQMAGDANSSCFQIQSLLTLLGKLSGEAELRYSTEALKSVAGGGGEGQCIKTNLEKSVGGKVLTEETKQKWPVS